MAAAEDAPMDKEQPSRVDCLKCMHYVVTWEPKFPRGCKLYGFKSAYLPSVQVLRSSGLECMGFEAKELKNER